MSDWRPFEPSREADDHPDRETVSLYLGNATWHDGPGWYYVIDDYPDEGSCGSFRLRQDAVDHAVRCGYRVSDQ